MTAWLHYKALNAKFFDFNTYGARYFFRSELTVNAFAESFPNLTVLKPA